MNICVLDKTMQTLKKISLVNDIFYLSSINFIKPYSAIVIMEEDGFSFFISFLIFKFLSWDPSQVGSLRPTAHRGTNKSLFNLLKERE